MWGRDRYRHTLLQLKDVSQKSLSAMQCFAAKKPLPTLRVPRSKIKPLHHCDILSTCMLPDDFTGVYAAVYTPGDGNCLYNALSQHLVGDVSKAIEIRCRVAYELVVNNALYASIAKSCQYYDAPSLPYLKAVCEDKNYSGILEIAAASNVLGMEIQTIYPMVNQGIRRYYHRMFEPEFRAIGIRPMKVMFTRFGDMLDVRSNFWAPNHFAYVVPASKCEGKTDWPEQRQRWSEIITKCEQIKDTLSETYPINIDLTNDHVIKEEPSKDNVLHEMTTCDVSPVENERISCDKIRLDDSADLTQTNTRSSKSKLAESNEHKRPHFKVTAPENSQHAIEYARDVLGIHLKENVSHIEPFGIIKAQNRNVYVSYDTLKPLGKGWGKYQVIRKADGNNQYNVFQRKCWGSRHCTTCKERAGKHKKKFCSGCSGTLEYMTCTCSLLYIQRKGIPGTLIITDGDHALSCKKQNPLNIADTNFYDGIIDFLGFDEPDVEKIKDIEPLKTANSDRVFVIDGAVFPVNKIPLGRKWKKLNSYNLGKDNQYNASGSWHVQYRNCAEGCTAKLKYFRSSEMNHVVIYHQGSHLCSGDNSESVSSKEPILATGPKYDPKLETNSSENHGATVDSHPIATPHEEIKVNNKVTRGSRKFSKPDETSVGHLSTTGSSDGHRQFDQKITKSQKYDKTPLDDVNEFDNIDKYKPADLDDDDDDEDPDYECSTDDESDEDFVQEKNGGRKRKRKLTPSYKRKKHRHSNESDNRKISMVLVDDNVTHVDVNHENPLKDVHITTRRSDILESDVKMCDKTLYQDYDDLECNEKEYANGFVDVLSNKNSSSRSVFQDENLQQGTFDSGFSIDDSNIPCKRSKMDSSQQSRNQRPANQYGVSDVKHCPDKEDDETVRSVYHEKMLTDDKCANWGRRELSNKKKRIYKRVCKGVFRCKNIKCLATMKENHKCKACHSNVEHFKCSAAVYYRIGDSDSLYDVRYQGRHSCEGFHGHDSSDVFHQHSVSSIPFDVDGNVSYNIRVHDPSNLWSSVSDGRKWGKYCRIKHNPEKTVYQRKCNGESVCMNDKCPFYTRYHKRNNAQFENYGNSRLCRECGYEIIHNSCPATKMVVVNNANQSTAVVHHAGDHSCSPIKKIRPPDKEISNLTKTLPNIKPAAAANAILKKALNDGCTPEHMSELSAQLINKDKIKRKTNAIRKQIYPHGTSIEAVNILNESLKTKGHDEYLIYHVQENPPMVLTTSREKLQIACDLTNNTDELWTTLSPYAHVDFQPSRVCGMTVLGVNCYHPNLKEMVCLFKLYAESETTDVVEFGFNTFNKAVKQFSNGITEAFNPAGWMSDESGAILGGLENVYGMDIHKKLATCKMHYYMSVSRLKSSLTPEKFSAFSNLAHKMEHSLTAAKYHEAVTSMKSFIIDQKCEKKLSNWLYWWDDRKYHWASAFRPKNNAPSTNLAEPVHSSE